MATIVRDEGATSLWRGLSPSLVMAVPVNVIYFAMYEWLRERLLASSSGPVEAMAPLLAGAAARGIAATVVSPVELVKTRMMSHSGPGALVAVLGDVAQLAVREGPRGLWRGLAPTLWRDVPFSGLYWLGYEALKVRLAPLIGGMVTPGGRPDPWSQAALSFACGSGSGAVAALLTTPFDVAKTQRQLTGASGGRVHTTQVLTDLVRQGGWRALFRGVTPRVLRTAPACGIMIGAYELGKVWFVQHHVDL